MFNKTVVACMIFASSSSIVFAKATPYVGAGIGAGNKSTLNIFGGYGTTIGAKQQYYLGGEVNLEDIGYSQLDHVNYGVGASIIPGIYINSNTMAYARAGIETTHYSNSHGVLFGTQLGLGLQTNVAKNWDVRGEYVHTANINTNQYGVGVLYKFD
jgi:opacity protein-like surface antigen